MKILGQLEREGMGVSPVVLRAMHTVDMLHQQAFLEGATFVHIMDGVHHKGSRHYVGLAFDLRVWTMDKHDQHQTFFAQVYSALTPIGFDVIDEGNHIHVEFDPKYPSL